MRILAISGSLRRDSHNSTLLRAAADLLPSEVELVIYERLAAIPPFNEDDVAERPAGAQDLWDAANVADGLLIATPEYNQSVSGVLKNALDWLSRPLAGNPLQNKPAVVVGASTGMFGAVWSQAETRKVLAAIGARVVDRELPVPSADEQFDSAGKLTDPELHASLGDAVRALTDAVGERLRRQATAR